MRLKAIRNVEHGLVETQFKWKIPHFFSIIQNEDVRYYESKVFEFGRINFQFRLYPSSKPFAEFMKLWLVVFSFATESSVEYSYGFETHDGSMEKVVRGMGNNDIRKDKCIFKISEIQERKSELAPSDIVTFICKLKYIPYSYDREKLEESKRKKLKKLDTLSQNFKSLLFNEQNCDVTLRVMDKVYKAHSVVLIARSSIFAAMVQQRTSEKKKGMIRHGQKSQKRQSKNTAIIPDSTINITDCDSGIFELFLKFLYCGESEVEELTSETALHLYEMSSRYNIQELKDYCTEFLIENLTGENFCNSVIIAEKYGDSELSTATQNFFHRNMYKVMTTLEWDSFVKNNSLLSKKYLKYVEKMHK